MSVLVWKMGQFLIYYLWGTSKQLLGLMWVLRSFWSRLTGMPLRFHSFTANPRSDCPITSVSCPEWRRGLLMTKNKPIKWLGYICTSIVNVKRFIIRWRIGYAGTRDAWTSVFWLWRLRGYPADEAAIFNREVGSPR